MESLKNKAINFDLDTGKMKEMSLYSDGYKQLKKSFKRHGFFHRQGSGYVSEKKLTHSDILFKLREIVRENPWIADCVKKFDVTDIGRQYDLVDAILKYASELREETMNTNSVSEPIEKTERASEHSEAQPLLNTNTNYVKLTGVLATQPMVRNVNTPEGVKVETSYGVAVRSEERTDVFQVVSQGTQAELDAKYLKQGNCVHIQGKLQAGYIEHFGQQIPSFNIKADKVIYLVPSASKTNAAAHSPKTSQSGRNTQIEF